jgi:tetratricopeptide (TPR) repeat protein
MCPKQDGSAPLVAKHASKPHPNLHRLHRNAYGSFHQGDLDRTERFCSEILNYRPDGFDALQLLGLLSLQQQRLSKALYFLSAAVESDPGSADALSNLGLAFHASERYEDAISCYRNGLKLAPSHQGILYNLGNAFRIANGVDAVQDGRIYIERANGNEHISTIGATLMSWESSAST